MDLSIFPVTPDFAAEIGDLDLRRDLTTDELSAVRAAFARYAVLIFPSQDLTTEQHLAFARHFGPLEDSVAAVMQRERQRVRKEIGDIANLDADGNIWKQDARARTFQMLGNRIWHTDSSFKSPSGYVSLLYARCIPPVGGQTEFADLRAAYQDLGAAMKARLEPLVAEHSLLNSRRKLGLTEFSEAERLAFAPVLRPLVRTLPETGRRTLYIASHVGRIDGLADSEAAALMAELTQHATRRQYVYSHRWRVGDLVMWDNRCTMHRGTQFDDLRWPRDLQRVTTSDRIDAFVPQAAHG